VHGANRLASNSLLDGLVFAKRAIDAIEAGKDGPDATGVMRGVTARAHTPAPAVPRGAATRTDVQQLMTRDAGVLRDAASLERAAKGLAALPGPSSPDVQNLMTVSAALVRAATARRESRGTHTRLDFPDQSNEFLGRFVFSGGEPGFVPLPVPEPVR
jgi:L-aspartate oxidase